MPDLFHDSWQNEHEGEGCFIGSCLYTWHAFVDSELWADEPLTAEELNEELDDGSDEDLRSDPNSRREQKQR